MAPAANSAKQRRARGSVAAHHNSDSDEYERNLQVAAAARTRIEKAREERDEKREALAAAHLACLGALQERMQKSITKYRDLHSSIQIRRVVRLKQAVDARDEKLNQIAARLADFQRVVLNHGVQLQALYEGRREDVAALLLLPEPGTKPSADIIKAEKEANSLPPRGTLKRQRDLSQEDREPRNRPRVDQALVNRICSDKAVGKENPKA
ncbi:hypothetical protein B0T24DRAFT_43820 [Lasiosphaeria ovina]|uniref:Uncharacterized protein n=1 Tax=Lasiosphaeria ovina TaxID=92902 RepID=A0AAE0NKP3_9PEZI|nr:hypothetical protein B0T24DRAFT_43820 [Lasiosphaeria ovina]